MPDSGLVFGMAFFVIMIKHLLKSLGTVTVSELNKFWSNQTLEKEGV